MRTKSRLLISCGLHYVLAAQARAWPYTQQSNSEAWVLAAKAVSAALPLICRSSSGWRQQQWQQQWQQHWQGSCGGRGCGSGSNSSSGSNKAAAVENDGLSYGSSVGDTVSK
jgi:hypothetical protein